MTIEETQLMLDDCFTYTVRIRSLKMELNNPGVCDKESIQNEINDLTEHVMNIRAKIGLLKGSKVKMVMRLRYFNLLSFKRISNELKLTYQWINKLHTNGVEQLSKML